MTFESIRLQVLGDRKWVNEKCKSKHKNYVGELYCVFPLFEAVQYLHSTFSHLFFSLENVHWWLWMFWVIKGDCRNPIKTVLSRHTLINLCWKLETASIYPNRWKRGTLWCSCALPFHVFLKSWFLGLSYTTKIQRNGLARLHHDYVIHSHFSCSLHTSSFLKWFHKAVSVV